SNFYRRRLKSGSVARLEKLVPSGADSPDRRHVAGLMVRERRQVAELRSINSAFHAADSLQSAGARSAVQERQAQWGGGAGCGVPDRADQPGLAQNGGVLAGDGDTGGSGLLRGGAAGAFGDRLEHPGTGAAQQFPVV